MVINYYKSKYRQQSTTGSGLINTLINKLPIELHLPGYQFCGPGTKLKERLARGDKGINALDSACKDHDIAYSQSKDLSERHKADQILAQKAWKRVRAKDSDFKERANAWFVTNTMKAKVKFGLGMERTPRTVRCKSQKKKNGKRKNRKGGVYSKKLFLNTVKNTLNLLKKENPDNINDAVKIAKKVVHTNFKGKRRSNISIPRVIPLPKIGGFLPLVPVLTALSAIGGLATGGSAIVKAINNIRNGKEQLAEATRHNRQMESIAMGKGLFLRPYKTGYGLHYTPYSKNF